MRNQLSSTYESASLSNPIIRARPNEFYSYLRENDPVHYDEELELYLVSRYADVQTVLQDPITFSVESGYKEQYAKGFFDEFTEILTEHGGGYFPDAIKTDPPYHTRIRKLMEHAFSAKRVQTLEPAITGLASRLIEQLCAKTDPDGMRDFAIPMTMEIICEQLGLPRQDATKLQKWSVAVTAQLGRLQSREQMRENSMQICELQNFLIEQIMERENAPREDMISDLVHAHRVDTSQEPLTFAEIVSLVRALLVAGNETTATALGNLLFILATQASVIDQIYASIDDDRFLLRFVEELLRIEPPTRGLPRMTSKEVELGGKRLPAGAHLLLLFASANDDGNMFDHPRNFDMKRSNLARHFSFGGGIHRCIGAALARMEIKVATREVARKISKVELAVPEHQIEYLPTIATRTLKKLPLIVSPRT